MGGDLVENLVWIALALAVSVNAVRLGLWTPAGPGSGFMPFLAAVLIAVISARPAGDHAEASARPLLGGPGGAKRRMILCVVGSARWRL